MTKLSNCLIRVRKRDSMTINFDKLKATCKEIEVRLDTIRQDMGAPLIDDFSPWLMEIDITGGHIQKLAQEKPDQPIIINNKFHIAYIKDHVSKCTEEYRNCINTHPNDVYHEGKKIHLYFCRTLVRMKMIGRSERYRAQRRFANPVFIDLPNATDTSARLALCQNCINLINRSRLSNKNIAHYGDLRQLMNCVQLFYRNDPSAEHEWERFVRETINLIKIKCPEANVEFIRHGRQIYGGFNKKITRLLGKSEVTEFENPAQPSNYPENWHLISESFRRRRNFTCEICGVKCESQHGLMHAHHRNGNKTNCNDKNLQCLCAYCHSKQPVHDHYKPKKGEMEALRQLWKEQNIPSPESNR